MIPSLPPRLLPVDEHAEKQLRKRTLTNLYNERPTWLANLHATLDAAVFAAYGWPPTSAMTRCWSGCSRSILSGRRRPLRSFVPHRRSRLHSTMQRQSALRMPVISETPNYVWVDPASNLASIARIGSSVRLKGCRIKPKILQRDRAEQRFIACFAQDDRRVKCAMRQRQPALADASLHRRPVRQRERHRPQRLQPNVLPDRRRQQRIRCATIHQEAHRCFPTAGSADDAVNEGEPHRCALRPSPAQRCGQA